MEDRHRSGDAGRLHVNWFQDRDQAHLPLKTSSSLMRRRWRRYAVPVGFVSVHTSNGMARMLKRVAWFPAVWNRKSNAGRLTGTLSVCCCVKGRHLTRKTWQR
jgi:hypothetical protein